MSKRKGQRNKNSSTQTQRANERRQISEAKNYKKGLRDALIAVLAKYALSLKPISQLGQQGCFGEVEGTSS